VPHFTAWQPPTHDEHEGYRALVVAVLELAIRDAMSRRRTEARAYVRAWIGRPKVQADAPVRIGIGFDTRRPTQKVDERLLFAVFECVKRFAEVSHLKLPKLELGNAIL